ncbi:MAG: glycosyl transferase group 1 [uncultured bacterium]|nr:MAG: glycosyl transferase group 1 [uncultured bacterium]
MTIGIDARLWSQTGVGRYIKNLVTNLHNLDKKNSYVLFVTKKDFPEVEKQIRNKNWKIVVVNISWHSISEQIKLPSLIKKEKVDLMHFPYFNVPIFVSVPFVVTIHDLIYHHFVSGKASTQPLWLYGFKMIAYRFVVHVTAKKAKKIIAVSNSTKNEIMDHLKIKQEKIEVTYEAADDLKKSNKKITLDNYFLFVGNVYPHKNVDTLIRAFKKVASRKDVKLLFVGREDFSYKKLKKKVSDLESSGNLIFKQDVDDDTLASYYKNAICLVRPSHMEGFSLPPLEAIANECLVIASEIPVHREIFGDSIIYFNSQDENDLAAKMTKLLSMDKKEKEQRIKKGVEKAKEFSWERTARQTLKIYESSLGL